MGHAYFSNLGNKVMTLPDSKCSPQRISEVTLLVRDELTWTVVSATSIFSLPEIQLEKEIVRPAVTHDPGDAHACRQTYIVANLFVRKVATGCPNKLLNDII